MKNLSVVTFSRLERISNPSKCEASTGKKKTRYDLPEALHFLAVAGLDFHYRKTRVMLRSFFTHRPKAFEAGPPVSDGELFDESALGAYQLIDQ